MGESGPHFGGGVVELGFFGQIELAAFFDGGDGVIDLVVVDEAWDGGGDGGIAEDVADGEACALIVFVGVGVGEGTGAFEEGVGGERFDAEDADVVFDDGVEEGVGGEDFGVGGIGGDDDLDGVGVLFDEGFEPLASVGGDACESDFALFFCGVEGGDDGFGFGGRMGAIHESGDAPDIDVIESGDFHAIFESLEEFGCGSPFGEAGLVFEPGEGEEHFIAAAFERAGVGDDFACGAGIDEIDAVFDASGEGIVAVFLEGGVDFVGEGFVAIGFEPRDGGVDAFPVTAEADGGDIDAGLAEFTVFHIGVEGGGVGGDVILCGEGRESGSEGGSGGGVEKLTA